jgi:hypothetical protein
MWRTKQSGPGGNPGPTGTIAAGQILPKNAPPCQFVCECPLRDQSSWGSHQRFKLLFPELYERIHRRPPIVHPCLVELERLCRAILIQGVKP